MAAPTDQVLSTPPEDGDAGQRETAPLVEAGVSGSAPTLLRSLDPTIKELRIVIPAPTAEKGILGSLKRLAETSAIIAALLYVAGWSYLYTYYRAFGISVGDLDLPLQVPLIYSFPVLFTWPIVALVSSLIILFGVTAQGLKKLGSRLFHGARFSPTSLLILVLLVAGKYLSDRGLNKGEAEAAKNMILSTTTLHPVNFKLRELDHAQEKRTQQVSPSFEACSPGDQYRLIVHANKQYFLFIPVDVPSGQAAAGTALQICVIPEERIESIQLQAPFPQE